MAWAGECKQIPSLAAAEPDVGGVQGGVVVGDNEGGVAGDLREGSTASGVRNGFLMIVDHLLLTRWVVYGSRTIVTVVFLVHIYKNTMNYGVQGKFHLGHHKQWCPK